MKWILSSTRHEYNIAQPKTVKCLSSPPHFHYFSPFNCELLFRSLKKKGITLKMCMLCFDRINLCFVLINSVLLNLLRVWILFKNASSHSCFRFVFFCFFTYTNIRDKFSKLSKIRFSITPVKTAHKG